MKLIYRKGIGEIVLRKNARAKRFSITIKPFDGVIVTVPKLGNYTEAEKIVDDKLDWIEKSLEKIEKVEEKRTVFDENTVFNTKKHSLKIISSVRENTLITIKNGILLINKPSDKNVRDEYIQQAIRKGITETYRMEAKAYVSERINYFAQKFNFKFKKLTIKAITSRWGSCSAVNNINISLYVMQLPNYLIDYIILHELSHTVVKNHGKDFWNLLNQLTGGKARQWDKEVNKYSTKNF